MAQPRPFSPDTTPEAQALLVERWRRMSPAQKAEVVQSLTRDCTALATAGIRASRPGASAGEVRLELARRRFGPEVAERIALLLPPAE